MKTTKKEHLDNLRRQLPGFTISDIKDLQRLQERLHKWDERECGGCNPNWSEEIQDIEDKPHLCLSIKHHNYSDTKTEIVIRNVGYEVYKSINFLLEKYPEWSFYHQSDPRGVSVYLYKKENLKDGERIQEVYSGIGVCVY